MNIDHFGPGGSAKDRRRFRRSQKRRDKQQARTHHPDGRPATLNTIMDVEDPELALLVAGRPGLLKRAKRWFGFK